MSLMDYYFSQYIFQSRSIRIQRPIGTKWAQFSFNFLPIRCCRKDMHQNHHWLTLDQQVGPCFQVRSWLSSSNNILIWIFVCRTLEQGLDRNLQEGARKFSSCNTWWYQLWSHQNHHPQHKNPSLFLQWVFGPSILYCVKL